MRSLCDECGGRWRSAAICVTNFLNDFPFLANYEKGIGYYFVQWLVGLRPPALYLCSIIPIPFSDPLIFSGTTMEYRLYCENYAFFRVFQILMLMGNKLLKVITTEFWKGHGIFVKRK